MLNFLSKFFKKREEVKSDDNKNMEDYKQGEPQTETKPVERHVSMEEKQKEILEKEGLKELQKSFVELSDKFVALMKEKFEVELGYKAEDLEKLENFMKENEKFFEKELNSDKKKLLPLLYAYLGEVIRRNHQGTWKKPASKQSAVEISGADGEAQLIYPGTLIKQRIEKKLPLTELAKMQVAA